VPFATLRVTRRRLIQPIPHRIPSSVAATTTSTSATPGAAATHGALTSGSSDAIRLPTIWRRWLYAQTRNERPA
jgi:hypothetical protein